MKPKHLAAVGLGCVSIGTGVLIGEATEHHSHVRPHIPGATVDVTVHQVCVPGYSTTVRPPVSYTQAVKRRLARGRDIRDYELDHLVPLSIGGDPTSTRNLWLEPWSQAKESDPVEWRLHREVCAGEKTLRAAQLEILRFKRRNG